jgi:hypothetical protein
MFLRETCVLEAVYADIQKIIAGTEKGVFRCSAPNQTIFEKDSTLKHKIDLSIKYLAPLYDGNRILQGFAAIEKGQISSSPHRSFENIKLSSVDGPAV